MKISERKLKVSELVAGYTDDGEDGVFGLAESYLFVPHISASLFIRTRRGMRLLIRCFAVIL